MTQEIGFVSSRNEDQLIEFEKVPVGKVLFLYQYHSCDTASRFPVKFTDRQTILHFLFFFFVASSVGLFLTTFNGLYFSQHYTEHTELSMQIVY